MKFIIYDIVFLILFVIVISAILYSKRKKITKEGLLLLYKTSWGIKLIDKVGKKYKKSLRFFSYVSISVGYFLMAGSIYLLGKIFWIYLTKSAFVKAVKIPPIMPIIPYIDKIIPNLGFPSFYFTYFIIILAIIAIPHEFFHGIFMRRYNIKIKSTGFGFFPFFFPVFFAAFVEQDEKSFEKAKKFDQMAVLSAGTFANLITAILFFIITLIFFSYTFHASGVVFDDYAFASVPISSITMVNNISLANPSFSQISELMNSNSSNTIFAGANKYYGVKGMSSNKENILLYYDSPAIRNNLQGAIIEVDGIKIDSFEKIAEIFSKKSPGQEIQIKTNFNGKINEYNFKLDENPINKSKPWLGVYFLGSPSIIVDHKLIVPYIGKRNIFYEPINQSRFLLFIENLLEWLILISISVAFVNMLPFGIFDGGRFFYLTVLGITKKESIAKKSFSLLTYFALFLLLLMMISWIINIFII